MLYSYNWLKQLLPDLKESTDEVAEKLSRSLAEVEGITAVGDDLVLEIENKALSHRADLFGMIGLAREVAALTDCDLEVMPVDALEESKAQVATNPKITIQLDNPTASPRYSAVIIKNLKVTESPQWLKDQLVSMGLRPINTVVDITNYLMLKYGQPLHAFDLDQLQTEGDVLPIRVRYAHEGEQITLLNGNELTLTVKDLVVANDTENSTHAIALAGIMGGAASQINEQTTSILIEAANFEMFHIRATSRNQAVRSDASMRFEKGVDPNLTVTVIEEALQFLTGSQEKAAIVDEYAQSSEDPIVIPLSITDVNYYTNTNQTAEQMSNRLTHLGFTCDVTDDTMIITVPSFRRDVDIKEDLYEEIGRVYDYNQIEPTLPLRPLQPPIRNEEWTFEHTVRSLMAKFGAIEFMTYSFEGEKSAGMAVSMDKMEQVLEKMFPAEELALENPIAPEFAYMRSSLIPRMTEATIENAKRFPTFDIFEINTVTWPEDGELPKEPRMLSFICYSSKQKAPEVLKRIKQIWQTLLSELRVTKRAGEWYDLQPLTIQLDGTKGAAFGYEIPLQDLFVDTNPTTFEHIPAHQPTQQDLSFLISSEYTVGEVVTTLEQLSKSHEVGQWLKKLSVLDVFQNDEMKKQNQHSITLRLTVHHPEKSLSDEEVSTLRNAMEQFLVSEYNATIR